MIGCIAEGESEAITLDRVELADARWFHRDDILKALAGQAPDFFVPPAMAIAHTLIRTWAEG